MAHPLPSTEAVLADVERALAEDVGRGDLTADLIPTSAHAVARVISRDEAVICGRPWFDAVFQQLDSAISIDWSVTEGEQVVADSLLVTLEGPARPLLTGERTALNFLQTLSGTATRARNYADAVAGTRVQVLDTRKTLPGLRRAQKYAVACGGCHNHRVGLYDGVLIKENHIIAAGSIAAAVAHARTAAHGVPIEVEVETLAEVEEALAAKADILLLDNMGVATLREAVALVGGRARLEASGGINLENIRAIAATGVDFISIGALTKDLVAVDLSMRFSFATPD